MYCKKCGAELEDGVLFCSKCGQKIDGETQEETIHVDHTSGSSSSSYNGVCIAGFVLSFFFGLLGLIFSIVGLNSAKRSGQKGKELAIAGIVISAVSIVGYVIYIILLVVAAFATVPSYIGVI